MDIQWALVVFTTLTGLGGWLFFFIGLNVFTQKTDKSALPGSVIALVLLALGGLASASHLEHPTRILGALSHPTSGIFTEALLIGLTGLAILVFIVMMKRGAKDVSLKVIAAIAMALGVVLSFMVGASYMMSSRPVWDTWLLPCGYIGTAMVSGAATYQLLIMAQKADSDALAFASRATLVTAAIGAITTIVYGAYAGAFTDATVVYVLGVLVAGVAIPAACVAYDIKSGRFSLPRTAVAAIGAITGALAFRAAMWLLGVGLYNFFQML